MVGSRGHRGPRALLGHLAPAAPLRASPTGCAQLVTWDISPCQKVAACDSFADVVSASLLSSYGRQQQWATQLQAPWATVVDDHTFLRPPPAPSCTAQGFCTPQPVALRPALGRAGPSQANQTVAVLLVARPTHRRLRPAGGRPPPALTVVRPCPWPMGHDGLSPSCRAKSIVAVMTLWQGYTLAQAAHTCVLA